MIYCWPPEIQILLYYFNAVGEDSKLLWAKGELWSIAKEEGNVLRKEEGIGSKPCVFWSIASESALRKNFALTLPGKGQSELGHRLPSWIFISRREAYWHGRTRWMLWILKQTKVLRDTSYPPSLHSSPMLNISSFRVWKDLLIRHVLAQPIWGNWLCTLLTLFVKWVEVFRLEIHYRLLIAFAFTWNKKEVVKLYT